MATSVGKVQPNTKLRSLEYARGIAVLLVCVGHYVMIHPISYVPVNFFIRVIVLSGMPLFFVLSGFLLTRQMSVYKNTSDTYGSSDSPNSNSPSISSGSWKRFFISRIFRIYPAYLVSLLILGIINHATLHDFFIYALNIHNLFYGHISPINPVYWSLAVEWQWYIAFPLLYKLLSGNKYTSITVLFFALFLGFAWRQYLLYLFDIGTIDFANLVNFGHFQLISHVFAFCAGIVCFHYCSKSKELTPVILIPAIVLCLTGGIFTEIGQSNPRQLWGVHLNLGTLFFLPCGASIIIAYLSINEKDFTGAGKKYFRKLIAGTGKISYSVYLWHYPVFIVLKGFTENIFLNCIFSFSSVILVSCLSYFLIEKYFLGLKKALLALVMRDTKYSLTTTG
ncbi:MAG: acyltransferase [Nitrospirae bacterium]|nr:acyltransferase [Nitrospirota bacterium]